jgi:hypothetical protein
MTYQQIGKTFVARGDRGHSSSEESSSQPASCRREDVEVQCEFPLRALPANVSIFILKKKAPRCCNLPPAFPRELVGNCTNAVRAQPSRRWNREERKIVFLLNYVEYCNQILLQGRGKTNM